MGCRHDKSGYGARGRVTRDSPLAVVTSMSGTLRTRYVAGSGHKSLVLRAEVRKWRPEQTGLLSKVKYAAAPVFRNCRVLLIWLAVRPTDCSGKGVTLPYLAAAFGVASPLLAGQQRGSGLHDLVGELPLAGEQLLGEVVAAGHDVLGLGSRSANGTLTEGTFGVMFWMVSTIVLIASSAISWLLRTVDRNWSCSSWVTVLVLAIVFASL